MQEWAQAAAQEAERIAAFDPPGYFAQKL
jgi:hypothetical protein